MMHNDMKASRSRRLPHGAVGHLASLQSSCPRAAAAMSQRVVLHVMAMVIGGTHNALASAAATAATQDTAMTSSRDARVASTSVTTTAITTTAWTVATTTITTTTTDKRDHEGCGGVERCLAHTYCHACLAAINASRQSVVGSRNSFETMMHTLSCQTNKTPPGVMYPAMVELTPHGNFYNSTCNQSDYDIAFVPCDLTQYECFMNPDCQRCVSALYGQLPVKKDTGFKRDVLNSSDCKVAVRIYAPPPFANSDVIVKHCSLLSSLSSSKSLLVNLPMKSNACGSFRASRSTSAHLTCTLARNVHPRLCVYKHTRPQVASNSTLLDRVLSYDCRGNLECTVMKYRCSSMPDCDTCWTMLRDGDGALAARHCPSGSSPSGRILDQLMHVCAVSQPLVCSFAQERCNIFTPCVNCSTMLDSVDQLSTMALTNALVTPSCVAALNFANQSSRTWAFTMYTFDQSCSEISACRAAVVAYVHNYGEKGISCLNGSMHPIDPVFCTTLHPPSEYGIDAMCQACPDSVHTINSVVRATQVVGGASVVTCLLLVATMFASGRDRESMRDRILIGLMLTNTMYVQSSPSPLISCVSHAHTHTPHTRARARTHTHSTSLPCLCLTSPLLYRSTHVSPCVYNRTRALHDQGTRARTSSRSACFSPVPQHAVGWPRRTR